MAINLHEKYSKNILEAFASESLLSGKLNSDYDFVGVKTVKISTLQTVPMNDYTRSGTNRYGTPTEMGDVVQELTLTQDKGFSLTIDKGNNADQNGIKAAGRALKLQLKERMVPEADKYAFRRLVDLAGTVSSQTTELTKTNVEERIDAGIAVLDNAEVPQDNRVLYVDTMTYGILKRTQTQLDASDEVKKAWGKGVIGEYGNMPVVKVPAGRWPKFVNFMIVYKNSATFPEKLNDTKIHVDPPGLSGNLLEGRHYYDCFVFGTKCMGIYVDVDARSSKGTVVATPTITAASGAITCATTGATIKYTTDGTDPRYSATAKVGTTSDVTTSGTVVKAYAYKADEGVYPSAVATATLS